MTNFNSLYAKTYNLVYANKDYLGESESVHQLLQQYRDGDVHKLISIGCGTLGHERLLVSKGYVIQGIDLSFEMVALAQTRILEEGLSGITVSQGDMLHLEQLNDLVDAVVAMFNVVSYCDGEHDFHLLAEGVGRMLRQNGLFVFDAWYAPAVRKDPPHNRRATFVGNGMELVRDTQATSDTDQNAINLNIETRLSLSDGMVESGHEQHRVHYWDVDTLARVLDAHGLEVVHVGGFPDVSNPVSEERWAMSVVAKKR